MVNRYVIITLAFVCVICAYIAGDLPSLENTDYAVSFKLQNVGNSTAEDGNDITLYIADLKEYGGSSEQLLNTSESDYSIDSISQLFAMYRNDTDRVLSLNHIRQVILEDVSVNDASTVEQLLKELSYYINVSDQVRVKLPDDMYQEIKRDDKHTVGFRELIKTIYKRESLYNK